MRIFYAIGIFAVAASVFWCGMHCGKSYEEVKAFMQSEQYKAQEKAFRSRF